MHCELTLLSNKWRNRWGKNAGKTDSKNYDRGSESHLPLCETWNIYKSSKSFIAIGLQRVGLATSPHIRDHVLGTLAHSTKGFLSRVSTQQQPCIPEICQWTDQLSTQMQNSPLIPQCFKLFIKSAE